MRFLFNLILMLVLALGVGFGLSFYALSDGRFFGATQSGPWVSWTRVGTPSPDPYTQAYITRNAALQLGQAEGFQLVASTDSDGRRLDRACRYRVDGRTPTSTFWTLIPVEEDDGRSIGAEGTPGFYSTRIARATDGSMQLYFSKTISPLNWVELTGDGPFSLVLTLYDTVLFSGVGAGDPGTLPSIIREAC